MKEQIKISTNHTISLVNAINHSQDKGLKEFLAEHFEVEMPQPADRVKWVKQNKQEGEGLYDCLNRYNQAIKVYKLK